MDSTPLGQLRKIVAGGLCHRCGACAGICPAGVIEPGEDYYPRWDGDGCTECGLCVRACPGISFSFPHFNRTIFGRESAGSDAHGVFLKAFLGYSGDPAVRERATSGGIATQIPLYLLKSGKAGGALVVASDRDRPWKPRAVMATTPEEIASGTLSKYPACALNHLVRQIGDRGGPFVFTGLPCHVQGLRKMEELSPGLGKKIALTVGIFCHSCLDHMAITDIFDIYRLDEREISHVEYRGGKLPGYVRARTRDGEWLYLPYPRLGPASYRPNAKECLNFLFRLYSPPRCRLCIDSTSEFADISIGDPWLKGWHADERLHRGYSFVIARTERGLRALEEAREEGAVVLEPYPGELVPSSHAPMPRDKQMRGFRNRARRIWEGKPAPDYGFEMEFTRAERLRQSVRAATYAFADRPAIRKMVLAAFLSRTGRVCAALALSRRRIFRAPRAG